MIGVPGTAHRLFGALRDEGISVVMISQGSSEHSICFAVPAAVAERAREAVERAFFAERHHGQIQRVDVDDRVQHSRGRRRRHGRPSRCRRAILQRARQGGREPARDRAGRVGAQHLGDRRRSGHAARAARRARRFLSLRADAVDRPRRRGQRRQRRCCASCRNARSVSRTTSTSICASARSRRRSGWCCRTSRSISERWREALEQHGEPVDLARLAMHVHADHLPHAVLIDCTASDDVARLYGTWLERGIHVITPNKRANTGPLEYYQRLRDANRAGGRALSVRDDGRRGAADHSDAARSRADRRRDLGDRRDFLRHAVVSVQQLRRHPLVLVARACRRASSATPSPIRATISRAPTSAARSSFSRARWASSLELADVDVQSLVPEALQGGTVAEFLAALPNHDAEMEALRRRPRTRGEVLRFVGRVDADGEGECRAAGVSDDASVRADSAHRQHRAVPNEPVS